VCNACWRLMNRSICRLRTSLSSNRTEETLGARRRVLEIVSPSGSRHYYTRRVLFQKNIITNMSCYLFLYHVYMGCTMTSHQRHSCYTIESTNTQGLGLEDGRHMQWTCEDTCIVCRAYVVMQIARVGKMWCILLCYTERSQRFIVIWSLQPCPEVRC
jgi:hypothetical protein